MTCDSNINSCSRKVKLYFKTVAKCKITSYKNHGIK
jgi:hypothetical protein